MERIEIAPENLVGHLLAAAADVPGTSIDAAFDGIGLLVGIVGLLLLAVPVSSLLVGVDARRRGLEVGPAVGVALLALVTFPIGLVAWLLARGQIVAALAGRGGSVPDPSVPPAGWYDDPEGGAGLRWWDGAAWTEHRQAAGDGG